MSGIKEEFPSATGPSMGEPEESVSKEVDSKEIDPKVGRSNNLVLIPQLDIVDPELAAKQRENRPFKVIQNLPFSEGNPNYSRFDNPLSMKDSATLYNSLLVSRYNWLHNIFRSYWTRREQYANLTDRKREKMSKFTECQVTCGPHTFEISMYILKDDEKERLVQEEMDKKRELKLKKKEERIKKSELQSQQSNSNMMNSTMTSNADLVNSSQQPNFQTPIAPVITPYFPTAPTPLVPIPGTSTQDLNLDMKERENMKAVKSVGSSASTTELKALGSNPDNEISIVGNASVKESKLLDSEQNYEKKTEIPQKEVLDGKEANVAPSEPAVQQVALETPNQKERTELGIAETSAKLSASNGSNGSQDKGTEKLSLESTPLVSNKQTVAKDDKTDSMKPSLKPSVDPSSTETKKPQVSAIPIAPDSNQGSTTDIKPKPNISDNMSSPENTRMISNLNAIARVDTNLNTLMKIVASGSASHAQITEFQEYIQKARSMGDVGSYYKKTQVDHRQQQENFQRQHQLLRQQQEEQRLEKQRQKDELQRQKLLAKQEKAERKAREKEQKEKERLLKKQQREFEKEQKRLSKQRGEPVMSIPKIQMPFISEKEEKLTAFQERYAKDAVILFEYQENTGARFYLPKDSVIEVLNDDKDNGMENAEGTPLTSDEKEVGTEMSSTENTPKPNIPKYKKPFVDILVSFLLVHNQEDIDAFDKEEELKRKAEEEEKKKQEEEKRKEEEKKNLEKQEAGENEGEAEEEPASKGKTTKRRKKANKWGATKRSTRSQIVKTEPEPEVPDELLDDQQPEAATRPAPVFSATTITLSNVPVRFADLIKNSANPLEEVQAKMVDIMNNGIRLSRYHTWLKLDGRKDEYLSELLRFNLNRLDYINSGGKLKGKAMLKRIAEVVGSEADITSKRPRAN